MPGRGPQTFKKRQKEQERRERQQEKFAKRLQRKAARVSGVGSDQDDMLYLDENGNPIPADENTTAPGEDSQKSAES